MDTEVPEKRAPMSRRAMLGATTALAGTALLPALAEAALVPAAGASIVVEAYGLYEAHHMNFPDRSPME